MSIYDTRVAISLAGLLRETFCQSCLTFYLSELSERGPKSQPSRPSCKGEWMFCIGSQFSYVRNIAR